MTNVRYRLSPPQQVHRNRRSDGGPTGDADDRDTTPALRFPGKLSLLVMLLSASISSAAAQDEHVFGRSLLGTEPSGSASGVVDVNRQGLGIAVQGGHFAGKTVGRNESASLFGLSPYVNIGNGLIFGDSRLVYANNGGLAWSFGGGYRHYVTAWDTIVGGYAYHDGDDITGAQFKQWSVGGELLSNGWEARANYYNPYGNTSSQTGTRIDPASAVFVGNNIQFTRINSFAEALKGFDAEIGWLLPGDFAERIDLRAFGGGYYYEGVGLPGFSGYSARLQADIANWLELGLKLTDDDVFDTNVMFNAVVHIGGFHSQEHTSCSAIQRMAEPVRRNINIATSQSDVAAPGQVATRADGTPFTVIHVNSNDTTGPFIGTVNDPLQSLSQGLAVPNADIVFVHAGSTFDAAPENTVVLADDQNLFGEGLIVDPSGNRVVVNTIDLPGIGELTLPGSPAFQADPTLLRPTISGSAGTAVTLGNRSRFGGFIVDNSGGTGIFADGVSDVVIRDTVVSNAVGDGILLQNVLSTATMTDTVISDAGGVGLHVSGGDALIGFTGTSNGLDPSFAHISNTVNEAVLIENLTGGAVNMTSSTIDDIGGGGIVIRDSAGNATIDNANIVDSTATGIAVLNSSGNYLFRDTIRNATTIDNATGASVLIDGLAQTGRVNFENLSITSPQGGGIDINNLAGQFNFTQDLVIGAAGAASTSPFISVSNSLATGVVSFSGDITIQAGNGGVVTGGRGIELSGNATGSSFTASGITTINGVGGEGIAIENDSSTIIFGTPTSGGVNIVDPGLEGISIMNSDGVVSFRNAANVVKDFNPGTPLVHIRDSQASVIFDTLQVLTTTGDTAVHLEDNVAGANGPGTISIDTLGIVSTGGVGLFGDNNTLIRTNTGNITTTGAAAVEIFSSGIDIDLEQVNSTNSPNYGIRLTDTNVDGAKSFIVRGDAVQNPTALSGGQILTAGTEGVLLENAGQVSLRAMELRDNFYGVRVFNSGLADDDDQFLQLFGVNVFESDIRGVEATNLTELDIRDSLFDDNGDLAPPAGATFFGRESVVLIYDEVPNDPDTTRFSEFDNPYVVNIQRTQFTDNTDDILQIFNTATAIGAHVDVNIEQNTFTVTDLNDFDPADLNETAVSVRWNGPARVNIAGNLFQLAGTNTAESQTAMFVRTDSPTDELGLEIVSNLIDNTTQPNAFGIDMFTSGPSSTLIDGNDMIFSGITSTGMRFTMAANTAMDIVNNRMAFQADAGTGILVDRLVQPASFQISNNLIQLSDVINQFGIPNGTVETGIFFRTASGQYTIFGAQNNVIEMLTFGNIERVFQFNGNVSGQIFVNGALVP
ncbi:MAG: right-handed parallel beta-helix repeat-containing protein [Planctomycetaceae bacterium]|nr:right-handed parallel beta-helix repeat-containing protein [Planctomycetaceae bacterium]